MMRSKARDAENNWIACLPLHPVHVTNDSTLFGKHRKRSIPERKEKLTKECVDLRVRRFLVPKRSMHLLLMSRASSSYAALLRLSKYILNMLGVSNIMVLSHAQVLGEELGELPPLWCWHQLGRGGGRPEVNIACTSYKIIELWLIGSMQPRNLHEPPMPLCASLIGPLSVMMVQDPHDGPQATIFKCIPHYRHETTEFVCVEHRSVFATGPRNK